MVKIHWYFVFSTKTLKSAGVVAHRLSKLIHFDTKTEIKQHHQPEKGWWMRAVTQLEVSDKAAAILKTLQMVQCLHYHWTVTLDEFQNSDWHLTGHAYKETDLKPGIAYAGFELQSYDGYKDPPQREDTWTQTN